MIYSVKRKSLHLLSQIEEAISSLRFKVMFQSIHIWAKKNHNWKGVNDYVFVA